MATPVETWIEKIRALAPVVAEWRDKAERQRRLPAPAFSAMKNAGLLRMFVPRRLGGYQASVSAIAAAVREMSRLDGAFGWNLMIAGSSGLFADYLPEAAEKELFPTGDEIGAGSFAPSGQAVEVEGGYRVTGRWGSPAAA